MQVNLSYHCMIKTGKDMRALSIAHPPRSTWLIFNFFYLEFSAPFNFKSVRDFFRAHLKSWYLWCIMCRSYSCWGVLNVLIPLCFSFNCRVKFYTQEIVFFRHDLLYRMRRSCLMPPSTEETDDPFEHVLYSHLSTLSFSNTKLILCLENLHQWN